VEADVDKLVKERFLIRQDGDELIQAAEKSKQP
jgi:hypothetical protein